MKILFVCLGNICRRPLAEGTLRKHAADAGLSDAIEIDSAGTGAWHVGEAPDRRMRATAQRYGVNLDNIRARRIKRQDLDDFDLILAMDRSNLEDIQGLATPTQRSKVRLFRSYDPYGGPHDDVPDPYYGGPDGFEHVFDIVDRTCQAIVESIGPSSDSGDRG